MAQNYFTYDITHKKSTTPNRKVFLSPDYKSGRSVLALEQLCSTIGKGAMALVRQLKTGFKPKSRYEYIAHRLSKR